MTKAGGPSRGGQAARRGPPEIAIEWTDVTIDIRVCGIDLPPDERGYTSLFPRLDEKLISSDVLDARRAAQKERKRMPGYKYETIPASEEEEEPAPKHSVAATYKVLPKLKCRHCGKTFSRKSTLDQHLVSHSSERWADVQDAASKDLELAIAASGEASYQEGRRRALGVTGEEEEEISPPPDVKEDGKTAGEEEDTQGRHRCPRCNKSFSRLSLLNRHMKLHSGVKPFSCNGSSSTAPAPAAAEEKTEEGIIPCPKCDRTFAAKAHLERHMPVHTTVVKPYSCVVCGWRFHLLHNMQRHLATHKIQDKVKEEEVKEDEVKAALEEQTEGRRE